MQPIFSRDTDKCGCHSFLLDTAMYPHSNDETEFIPGGACPRGGEEAQMSNDENHARQESELIRQARQQIGIDSTKRQTQDTEGQGTVVRCPHCGERIPLQMDMGHDLVRCPSCENEFNLLFEVETASFSGKTPKALGHYQLLEHLGMGQYGSVWKALDTQLDRVVALKIPRRTELAPGESEIFLREGARRRN